MTTANGENSHSEEVWYLALRALHIPQGPGIIPSSIRFKKGQRFALDGDEPIDLESLIRTQSVKIYEESDREWAEAQLNEPLEPLPKARKSTRRTRRGKN